MNDFAALPPEINSGQMYAGPGTGPMLAASSAWDGLAAELDATARAYGSVLSSLASDGWRGPAAMAMVSAAAPYVDWLRRTAARAERTAASVRAATAAYEAAFAATAPPVVVAANRAHLAALVATNFLGQNTPAIAATEAQYVEMWAQDAAAMFGYAGDSAVATRLTPFSSPPVTTNPAGLPEQAAAVAQAAGTDGGGLVSAVPMALEGLAAPAPAASSSPSPFMVLSLLTTAVSIVASSASVLFNTIIGPITLTSIGVTSASLAQSQQKQQEKPQDQSSPPQSATATTVVGEATARMGNATTVGRLAVPASWQFAAPAQLVSTALRHAGLSAAAAATPLNPDTANGLGLAIAAMASAGLGGAAGSGLAARPRAEATSTASQYGKAMAATLGHPGATRDRNAGSDISDADHNSGETPAPETLTGLERDILALVRRYTASPGT